MNKVVSDINKNLYRFNYQTAPLTRCSYFHFLFGNNGKFGEITFMGLISTVLNFFVALIVSYWFTG